MWAKEWTAACLDDAMDLLILPVDLLTNWLINGDMPSQASLDAAFAALANPTRRAILARLARGEATVNELAEPFDMSLPAVSKHIRVLEEAGFISRGKHAQFRPCTLDAKPLQAVATWTDQYRHIWAARFDAMDNALQNIGNPDND